MDTSDRLLRAECDAYRRALILIYCQATSGGRKTMDKAEVARLLEPVLEAGNELSRRAKVAS